MKRSISLRFVVLIVVLMTLPSCEQPSRGWEFLTRCDGYKRIAYSDYTDSLWVAERLGSWITQVDTKFLLALDKSCSLPQLLPDYYSLIQLPKDYKVFEICSSGDSILLTALSLKESMGWGLLEYDLIQKSWTEEHTSALPIRCHRAKGGSFIRVDGDIVEQYADYQLTNTVDPGLGTLIGSAQNGATFVVLTEAGELYISEDDLGHWSSPSGDMPNVAAWDIVRVDGHSVVFLGNRHDEVVENITEQVGLTQLSYPAYTLYEFNLESRFLQSIMKISNESGEIVDAFHYQ